LLRPSFSFPWDSCPPVSVSRGQVGLPPSSTSRLVVPRTHKLPNSIIQRSLCGYNSAVTHHHLCAPNLGDEPPATNADLSATISAASSGSRCMGGTVNSSCIRAGETEQACKGAA